MLAIGKMRQITAVWGTTCGADVGWRVRSRTQYCSGTSASCTGSWSTWSAWSSWYTEDYCGTSEYCTDDDSTCNSQCSSGACCDGCRYKTSGSQPTGYTDDTNGFCSGTNGANTTSYVYIRDYYCNGTDASMHYTDTLQDTCGTCEYCTDNDLTCNTYGDGTVCDTGKTCQGGSCLATCSSLSYPTDKWQRVWYDWSANCLGDWPDEPSATFDNNWGTGVIAYSLSDNIQFYSSRKIYLSTAGIWRFVLGSDDGSRLYVDGALNIDNWTSGSYRQRTVSLDLSAGWHNFEIDYYEAGTSARVSFTYNYDAESAACNTECARRGYGGGECYTTAYPPPPFTTPFCSGYTFADLIPDQGACSGATVGCVCCHNCPSSPPGDNVSVGSCSVNITGTGWDYTDGSSVGFHELDKDTNWRSYWMCDAPSGSSCASNLQIKNSWPTVSGDQITVRTDILGRSASHDLGAGFIFNGGTCKYTVNLVGTTESSANVIGDELGACETGTHTFGMTRDANTGNYLTWMMEMEYCGDGECNCGETCTSCQTDCGSCDIISPTTVIQIKRTSTGLFPTESWLRADTYTIEFTDSDNVGGSGLRDCHYYINSCNADGSNCTTVVESDRTRTCNWSKDIILGTSPYTLEGIRYLIYSYVYDNAGNGPGSDSKGLKTDFTVPGTDIR